ncbi:hypothetical protein PAAG_08810 [Paracoccidioides lutzii Pb01]|uniref:Uncharacterized protein n=1 Tax=Paracoccidioides lutzii (strain ATCC MYA-826 / Pb01) TaxID=502779 RepID=C1HDG9_PARBA|nr:hypothetical protein PAAG_08810 [Paracoccidioides lutzii Pb01]EEH39541.2 hypothetical protein PAAG_08810 [Paracoccidioides lutzii Pb01]
MVSDFKRNDVIYHWLSEVVPRNVHLPPNSLAHNSAFIQREDSSNTKQNNGLQAASNKGREGGCDRGRIAESNQAPQIEREKYFTISELLAFIATMNADKEARKNAATMQNLNKITRESQQQMPCAHPRVPSDALKDATLPPPKEFSVAPAAGNLLPFTTGDNVIDPYVSVAESVRPKSTTAQSPVTVSHLDTTVANHDSRNFNPPVPNEMLRSAYDRRPRHKTRLDKYELKGIVPSAMPSDSTGVAGTSSALKRGKKRNGISTKNTPNDASALLTSPYSTGVIKKPEVRKGGKRKDNSLVNNFKAPNVAQERLSLPINPSVGFLNKARVGRGVPDLSFSGMGFLSNSTKRPSESEPNEQTCAKRAREGNDSGETISQYFSRHPEVQPLPNLPAVEDCSQRAPQPLSTFLSNPKLNSNQSRGTEPVPPDQNIHSFVSNIPANSFRDASVNPAESTSNPLRRQINRPTTWLSQAEFRAPGSSHETGPAWDPTNIAILDHYGRVLQHTAKLLSHKNRLQINAEVDKEYPMSKLVSQTPIKRGARGEEAVIKEQNRFLSQFCSVFESDYTASSDIAEECDDLNAANGAASKDELNIPAPAPFSWESTHLPAAPDDIQRSPSPGERSRIPKEKQRAVSSSNSNHQVATHPASNTNTHQLIMHGRHSPSESFPSSVSRSNNTGQHSSRVKPNSNAHEPEQNRASRTIQISALTSSKSNHQLIRRNLENPIQYEREPDMGNGIPVVHQTTVRGHNNARDFNDCNFEANGATHVEQNSWNPTCPQLWSTRGPSPIHHSNAQGQTDCIPYGSTRLDERQTGSIINREPGYNSIRVINPIQNKIHLSSHSAQLLYSKGQDTCKREFTANGSSPSHSITRNIEWPFYAHANGESHPETPTSSIRSGRSNNQNFDADWVSENRPARFVGHHPPLDQFCNNQNGHQNSNSLQATPRSAITILSNSPWRHHHITTWTPSHTTYPSQIVPDLHSNFTHPGLFPRVNEVMSPPPNFLTLPFSHPNRLY